MRKLARKKNLNMSKLTRKEKEEKIKKFPFK